ncbi:hypothetical protein OPU71_18505 [Niveibacterium sp. 24ML]|uniref:hypothetical protein n=1 Tax=Niveibacterium sp. 24ML TaxID=2985512 RepID=UPI00226E1693|nr:hypothetical protein [Niveibacterium sp. 24ML]MCX9158118.1 hypothetical protein [Niveibacterium sp. 24ML]
MTSHLVRMLLAAGAFYGATALAADQYVGTWTSTTDPSNQIEIKQADGHYEVLGREAIIYADKPTQYRPKTYKATRLADGSLRIAFFAPQVFAIDASSGELKSKRSAYRRAEPKR